MVPRNEHGSLRAPLDRLYEQEREERNERRGLEQRAATTVAGSLVGLGLSLNALGTANLRVSSAAGVVVLVGSAATITTFVWVSAALAGLHTNEEASLRRAIRRIDRRPLECEPYPLTDEYVEGRRLAVEQLRDHNATMVRLLRLGSWGLAIGVYFVLFGVGWRLLQ